MSLFGGDKNSPKQQQTSTSTTKNTNIQPTVSTGSNSPVSVGPTLSDVTNTGKIDISTTDQGAIAAGLQIASKALDNSNAEIQSLTNSANSAVSGAQSIASQAAAGQSNTSLKYLIIGGVALAAVIAAIYIYGKK